MKQVRIVQCGLGNVGKAFLQLVVERSSLIAERYGIRPTVVAAVDIGGAAMAGPKELPAAEMLTHLRQGGSVEDFHQFGRPDVSGETAIQEAVADVLIETTPTNLTNGEPGKTHIMAALGSGMDVVSANKGPLVLFYEELHELARQNNCGLHISAATAAALPTLDVGQVCLAGAQILAVEGILNGTTNYILSRMHEENCPYDMALEAAQEMGIAETNPDLDVEGYDTANKLTLIANRVFRTSLRSQNIEIQGITNITPNDVTMAISDGQVIKLIGCAEVIDGDIRLSVAPKRLEKGHHLASVNGSEKAISYLTDTMDRITVIGGKSSPVGAAAALMKDLINAYISCGGKAYRG